MAKNIAAFLGADAYGVGPFSFGDSMTTDQAKEVMDRIFVLAGVLLTRGERQQIDEAASHVLRDWQHKGAKDARSR